MQLKPIQQLFLLVVLLFSLSWIVYWPGLSGGFLFDDYANLPAIGKYDGVRDLETLRLYLANGIAGPTGRPISLLSFLINATNWPVEAYSFKLTNIWLHVINGALLFFVVFQLMRVLGKNLKSSSLIAFFSSGLWLLHPFFVSTTLYVVQRMAMLPATFSLVAFIAYLTGRVRVKSNPKLSGLLMGFAVYFCTLLAVFSKENGALLPLQIALLEIFLVHSSKIPRMPLVWRWILIYLPVSLVIMGFAYKVPSFIDGFASRPFSTGERMLTEGRAVALYIKHLFFPSIVTGGVYTDNFQISRGLMEPMSTLLSWLFILSILAFSWISRQRWPVISFAVFFFFVSHIVESTVVPLELYFEHRNYIPALFLFLPVSVFLVEQSRRFPWLIALPVTVLLVFSWMTHQRATLWGDNASLILAWAEQNPSSVRAQRVAFLELKGRGQLQGAEVINEKALREFPENLALLGDKLMLQCATGKTARSTFKQIMELMRKSEFDYHYMMLYRVMALNIADPICRNSGLADIDAFHLLARMQTNASIAGSTGLLRQLHHVRGKLYLKQKKLDSALQEFSQSFKLRHDLGAGMQEVALLATAGAYEEALSHLDAVEQELEQSSGEKGMDYGSEIKRIRKNIIDSKGVH